MDLPHVGEDTKALESTVKLVFMAYSTIVRESGERVVTLEAMCRLAADCSLQESGDLSLKQLLYTCSACGVQGGRQKGAVLLSCKEFCEALSRIGNLLHGRNGFQRFVFGELKRASLTSSVQRVDTVSDLAKDPLLQVRVMVCICV